MKGEGECTSEDQDESGDGDEAETDHRGSSVQISGLPKSKKELFHERKRL